MFTDAEKRIVMAALVAMKGSLERSKAKARNPAFGPIYDEDIRILAGATMKVSNLEVKNEAVAGTRK